MKRNLTVVGIALLSAATLPLMAQEGRPMPQIMKEIGGSVGVVKKAFDGQPDKQAVADAGEKLERLFKEVEVFFEKRGTADAVESSKNAEMAAKELHTQATSGTKATAQEAFGKVTGSCKGCHEAHREKLSDGTYKIK